MNKLTISQRNQYSPVESVRWVEDKIGKVTMEIIDLQRMEVTAAFDRFFPQGHQAAINAGLIVVVNQVEGVHYFNHNGDFICFLGNIETGFNCPDRYSRPLFSSVVEFKFRAFDGKTTRD